VARPSAVLRVLDRLRPDSVEVSDKATMVAAGGWARERGVGAVLFSHERLDLWLAARLPGLWRHAGGWLTPAVGRWNRRLAGRFDVVISDVFAGARTPPHLTTAEFAGLAARALDGSDQEVSSSSDVQLDALVALLTDALQAE